MQKRLAAALLCATSLSAFAGNKLEGTTTLKDSQPYGVKDTEHKHQGYDLAFDAKGKSYTCRTDPSKSMNATDFVVGTDVTYKIDGNKAKIKTPQNKEVECKIVRVEALQKLQ
jgi:uncharacterized protein YcfJ